MPDGVYLTTGNTATWNGWVLASYYDVGTSTTTGVWNTWVSGTVSTTSITIDAAARIQPLARATGQVIYRPLMQEDYEAAALPVLTPEQVAEAERLAAERVAQQQRANAEYQAREKERAAQRAIENQIAEALLLENLTPTQRSTYQRDQYIPVVSDDGKRTYRITRGVSGNVQLVEGNKVRYRFCIHPPDDSPVPDVMLGQLLLLKTDELEFLRIANKS